jgi:hypothetical protein
MLNVTNTEVFGWQAAIRGMRNPKNSWEKSDSRWHGEFIYATGMPIWDIGPNDLTLMKKLIAAGSDHSKFMRMIHVQCDWEAPLYWWKEADTYKVGTVRNSCSTMHTITEHEFTFKDFACEHLERRSSLTLSRVIDDLNYYREYYLSVKKQNVPGADAKAKEIWWQIIQLLPSSYLQKATMDFNYAVLRNMYHSRKAHKQDEWRIDFCNWVKTLPYSELITMTKEELLESIKEE